PGLWYTITGTGETITLSTCGAADFDTKISVYSGTCGQLTCVAGVDDAPGCSGNTTELYFPSEAGVPYLVLVHAYQDGTGTFTLTASCAATCSPIAANDDCANAEALPLENTNGCIPTVGSNECAFASGVPNPPCDPYDPVVDVWYAFNTGTQESITIFIAALGSEPLNAAVYTACGSIEYLDCETALDGPWQINGLEPDMDLLLRVWNGGGPDAGNFAVCIESDLPSAVQNTTPADGARLWPNPALDRVQVSGVPDGSGVVELIDLQGRVLRHVAVNGQHTIVFAVHDLDAGTYIVRALGTSAMPIGRFVKQ
ncbi:MAG TPA: T9SS type A sorting domain-containing protein, partial [Flavobacteriales bacterium]|nr:T9SS type A sorting domain-containing protein [Flavobacteriales bacterium]